MQKRGEKNPRIENQGEIPDVGVQTRLRSSRDILERGRRKKRRRRREIPSFPLLLLGFAKRGGGRKGKAGARGGGTKKSLLSFFTVESDGSAVIFPHTYCTVITPGCVKIQEKGVSFYKISELISKEGAQVEGTSSQVPERIMTHLSNYFLTCPFLSSLQLNKPFIPPRNVKIFERWRNA